MTEPTNEQIRARAHRLWEEAGRPEGCADEFWHRAEAELREDGDGRTEMTEPLPTVFPG